MLRKGRFPIMVPRSRRQVRRRSLQTVAGIDFEREDCTALLEENHPLVDEIYRQRYGLITPL
jgi:hypothetical protein